MCDFFVVCEKIEKELEKIEFKIKKRKVADKKKRCTPSPTPPLLGNIMAPSAPFFNWSPLILPPPWGPAFLPAAFYPAALRSALPGLVFFLFH